MVSVSFVSASWFSNFFGKITGQAASDDSTNIGIGWTQWYDRDDSSGTGDWEDLTSLRSTYPGQICDSPSQVECQTTTGIDYILTGQNVTCNVKEGFYCYSAYNPSEECLDYKVRFYCGEAYQGDTYLSSDNPITMVTFNNYTYQVELISASDTTATIKVTQGGISGSKEVNEGQSKEINGLNVYVKTADETNLFLSAVLGVSLVNEEAKYIIEKDFGVDYERKIIYDADSLESGINADGVDAVSEYFSGFVDGESATYHFEGDLNDHIVTIIVEFDHKLSFKEFNLVVGNLDDGDNIAEIGYSDLEKIGLEGTVLTYLESEQYANYWYTNNNKFVAFVNIKEDSIDENDDSFIDFLGAYLDKYPSTLEVVKGSSCENGCSLDGECYPYNNRVDGNYCVVGGVWTAQLQDKAACDNNFECSSNVCVSNQCVEGNLIQKILNWFRKLFGRG